MVRSGADRFVQEKIGRPIADRIYRNILGSGTKIVRDEDPELDRKLGIDVILTLNNGLRLLGQEKFLSRAYSQFRSMTVEHYQNWQTKAMSPRITP